MLNDKWLKVAMLFVMLMLSAAVQAERTTDVSHVASATGNSNISDATDGGIINNGDWGANNSTLFGQRALVLEYDQAPPTDRDAYEQFKQYFISASQSGWRHFSSMPTYKRLKTLETLWVGVRVVNDSRAPQFLYYRNLHTTLPDGTVFLWRSDQAQIASFGDIHTRSTSSPRYHHFTHPVELAPGETVDLLVKINGSYFPQDSIERSQLRTQKEMALDENITLIGAWFIMGGLFLLVLLCAFAAISLRSQQFAMLGLASLAAIAMQLDV